MMPTLRRLLIMVVTLVTLAAQASAQNINTKAQRTKTATALQAITLNEVAGSYVKVEELRLNTKNGHKQVVVKASAELAYYPMRPASVAALYDAVRESLPAAYAEHSLAIYANGTLIDNLIPQYYTPKASDKHFTHTPTTPLVTRHTSLSQPTAGLANRHIALWQSHGRYFKASANEWRWQRSCLWQTVEDLYTQSYVVPYLVPMLERAGANVLLPRERSMTHHEVIADNDKGITPSTYCETSANTPWQSLNQGFAHLYASYASGHNPFDDGTARYIATTHDPKHEATASWGAHIPKSGYYSLYVAYRTLPNSVSDARYTIHASGAQHQVSVNQTMGSAMWICLGDYYFEAGDHTTLVTLSNLSTSEGVVVADAIKIGGGMGNICRSASTTDTLTTAYTSGYPRFTEGARYWLQWSGFPTEVYAAKQGTDDYKEDYMSRALWVNHLMGGSDHLPTTPGKGIPIDMAFALHSDAGVRTNDTTVGTLGIYCTKDNDGLFANDISRHRSRDLTDIVMTQIVDDIRTLHEPSWTRRGMWDRAYYEARIPNCPTMLLELLSHQNFGDMRYGLDPTFQFDVSRAIYKGILRYLASQYGTPYVVQPLAINSFAITLNNDVAHLSWLPTADSLEPTAMPDYYILYTKVDDSGFDTGQRIDGTTTELHLEPNRIYSFRITAVNSGGESFNSETLAACYRPKSRGCVMVINGFDRISAPEAISTATTAGFPNDLDMGVPYISDIAFIGQQTIFDRALAHSNNDNNALGTSRHDYETTIIAGNTFDYASVHGKAIAAAGYSFTSASHKAIESGHIDLNAYAVVDLMLGKQRSTTTGSGHSGIRYEVLPEALQHEIEAYTKRGGALLVTGAYTLTDLYTSPQATNHDMAFATEVLRASFGGSKASTDGIATPATLSRKQRRNTPVSEPLHFNTTLSEDIYIVESPEVVNPIGNDAYTLLQYSSSASAAIASTRGHRVVVMGFPFETILDEEQRTTLMSTLLKFLTKNKKR